MSAAMYLCKKWNDAFQVVVFMSVLLEVTSFVTEHQTVPVTSSVNYDRNNTGLKNCYTVLLFFTC
jgi:hypothetical protein